MKRKLIKTADGSHSLYLPEWDEHYHSKHGAIQEAYHVFIRHGLDHFKAQKELAILEIGFGTGLNALITFLETAGTGLSVDYTGVEAFPLAIPEVQELNYPEMLGDAALRAVLLNMHRSAWEVPYPVSDFFSLTKQRKSFSEIADRSRYDLIYFDAFGPNVQPELWTPGIFEKMYIALKDKGLLVTYSAKGSVRRAMQSVGFEVTRLPGPPGKREMLSARKV